MIEKYKEIIEKQQSLISELVQCVNMHELSEKIELEKKQRKRPDMPKTYNPAQVEVLIEYWCQYYNIEREKLESSSRESMLKLGRYMVFWTLHKQIVPNRLTLSDIGGLFNRNHATVIHGVKALDNWLLYDEVLRSDIQIMFSAFGYESDWDRVSKTFSWKQFSPEEITD